jgi:hypothetical protein
MGEEFKIVDPSPSIPPISVIWSGGFDSTALVIKYLEEGRQVHTLAVSLTNNKDQAKFEKIARERIWKMLNEEFPNKLTNTNEMVWPEVLFNSLPQPPIWLYNASMNCPTNDVALGYVRYDDIWHYRREVLELVRALDVFKGQTTTLHFPFEWNSKEELLPFYVKRPHVFHIISTDELGMPWSLGNSDKCKEMQELSEKLKKLIYVQPTETILTSLPTSSNIPQ